MSKTLKILSEKSENIERFICLDIDNAAFPRMGDLPTKLKYPTHIANIYAAISKNNYQELEKLLIYDMQCSRVCAKQGSWGATDAYHVPSTYTLYTRPFVEWLFFEERDEFHRLIKVILGIERPPSIMLTPSNVQGDLPKISNVNSPKFDQRNAQGDLPNTKLSESTLPERENLCKAFVNCLKNTDLKNPLFLDLNQYAQKIINLDLVRLKMHSKTLESNQDESSINRSKMIKNLLVSLTQQFSNFLQDANNLPEYMKKLWTLNFKLDFVKKIHSKDKCDSNDSDKNLGLIEHRDRGATILFANTLSMLLAGIPNLMLGIATKGSQWLFFQKTETQNLLTELESNLNLPRIN